MHISSLFTRKTDSDLVWDSILTQKKKEWESYRKQATGGTRVLIATSLGGYQLAAIVESALAVALTVRGASVDILLCDHQLPACQMTKISRISPEQLVKKGQMDICHSCFRSGFDWFTPLGLPVLRYSQYLTREDRTHAEHTARTVSVADIASYHHDGVPTGEHAYAGALRYSARGDLTGEQYGEEILRKYFASSLLSTVAMQRLLRSHSYDVVCFHHGIYVPQGIIGAVCRNLGVRVVNWNPAYRRHRFIFSHDDSYHHTMIDEPTAAWEHGTFSKEKEKMTVDYLKSREKNTNDWIWFHRESETNKTMIGKQTGIDFSRPLITVLTSVMWDARLHYVSNAFTDMQDWIIQTIQYFTRRPDLQLAIRAHPAEVTSSIPSRQRIDEVIRSVFPSLPKNVIIIPPESPVSTYALARFSNAVIIYNTKAGCEVAAGGIPVIVAGEAWIRNKGFSLDAHSPGEYVSLLDSLPLKKKMSNRMLKRARMYAHHFFFRRMIPLPFIRSPKPDTFTAEIGAIDDLLPGHFPGLDVICSGILKNTPFVYDQ